MKTEVKTNINMDNKDHIVLGCDTLGTPVPEARQNIQISSLTEENIQCVNEKVSHYNNPEDSSERVNYYDNESYVLKHLKTEFPEDVLPQSDCNLNSQIHSENKELLEVVVKTEIKDENTEDELSLNIKQENDYNEHQFTVKTERLEEEEDVQQEFYHNTLNNSCNLLQNSNKPIKVEIDIPVENGITELHQCIYCGKGFDNYNKLLVHISNDHKPEKFKCEICRKQFKSVGNLNRHIMAVHKLDKPVEAAVTENYVNNHVNVQQKFSLNDHSKLLCSGKEGGEDEGENKVSRNISDYGYGSILECSFEKQFPSPIHLREHQEVIQQPKIPKTNNKRFQCGSCINSFKTKGSLDRHIKSVHVDYGRMFNCWCGKEFRSPFHLNEHERLIHKRNVQKTTNDNFQCEYCKVSFKTKRYLSVHIKRVHYDYGKWFDCWCGKQFRSPIQLNGHERRMHRRNLENTNNDKIQCEYCKKIFTTKSNLGTHLKTVHFVYDRKFDCWCGKQFRSPLHLRKHEISVHRDNVQNTSNDKFQCDYCKMFFKLKTYLVAHIKRVHYGYGKRFICWCGKQFNSPTYLCQHERHIHRDNVQNTNNCKFQCDYCKKIFTIKSNLTTHIRTVHLDYGRKFDCWCGKQFRSPIHLRQHERLIHERSVQNTNNVIFQCDYCKIYFKRKTYLWAHIKRVHYDYGKLFDCWCGKQFNSPIQLRDHKRFIKSDPHHSQPGPVATVTGGEG